MTSFWEKAREWSDELCMATHRMGETGLSESGPSTSSHHAPYGVLHGISSPSSSLINQGSSYYFGGLEEAILQGVKIRNEEAKASLFAGKPAATLEMFPSWPMRFQHTQREIQGGSKSGGESTDSGSGLNTISSKTEAQFEPESESPISKKASCTDYQAFDQQQKQRLQQLEQEMASDASRCQTQNQNESAAKPFQAKRKGGGSTSDRQLDPKTMRRLAQNREAARKSRLRKKAYVQQLESSRVKLSQLEQELQRARSQGLLIGCGGTSTANNISSAIFDIEYGRWLEEDQRHMEELRRSLEAAVPDNELRVMVESYLRHYDEVFELKGVAAKSDVFHVMNGMWTTPAERCFFWIAGFRPSDLIGMLVQQLEPVTEQQIVGMYGLRQSTQQAEEALTQGLDQLQHSLLHTVVGGLTVDGVHQMFLAMTKLSDLEDFIRQADNLRQQTLHQLCRLLTVRQAAKCFLVIGEYYGRLRALSSLWASRPRESLINDETCHQIATNMPIVHQSSQNHFSTF
ncbi:transcription factor TGA9-like isoform X2 [Neltuma alba]|uniref:transcription factor TGA9-like isoform X2 n=1 Tax=Neltuma alba TaxID=207710 RepID=UPI0010A2DA0D|nr:transcription factor TGA9-like isoform X2 [Prosopis alba]